MRHGHSIGGGNPSKSGKCVRAEIPPLGHFVLDGKPRHPAVATSRAVARRCRLAAPNLRELGGRRCIQFAQTAALRATPAQREPAQRLPRAAVGNTRRHGGTWRSRSYGDVLLPRLPGVAAGGEGAGGGDPPGLRARCLDALRGRPRQSDQRGSAQTNFFFLGCSPEPKDSLCTTSSETAMLPKVVFCDSLVAEMLMESFSVR